MTRAKGKQQAHSNPARFAIDQNGMLTKGTVVSIRREDPKDNPGYGQLYRIVRAYSKDLQDFYDLRSTDKADPRIRRGLAGSELRWWAEEDGPFSILSTV
jgi:hypothetical protein